MGHGLQSPIWQKSLQVWLPQDKGFSQTLIHKWWPSGSFPFVTSQQSLWHLCFLQERYFLQILSHKNCFSVSSPSVVFQHSIFLSFLWHLHFCVTSSVHLLQGPGWHDFLHLWPHGRTLPHGSPQTGIGSKHDFLLSSPKDMVLILPQQHVYIFSGV